MTKRGSLFSNLHDVKGDGYLQLPGTLGYEIGLQIYVCNDQMLTYTSAQLGFVEKRFSESEVGILSLIEHEG